MDEMKKAFTEALEFEKNGYKIYEETSKTTFNPIVKKIFSFLAEEELNHIRVIDDYLKENNLEINFGKMPNEVKDFFNMTIDEFKTGIEFTNDDILAYEKAMQLEKSGHDFYLTKANETNNSELKDFFMFLVDQEKSHYIMLEKNLKFIKNPENFFSEEEEWNFEG
jgi:rubrerythrin